MVKLQLQAVSFQPVFLYQTPGIISLCTETCIRKPFSVYDNITLKVSLRGSSLKKCIPVINLQVNGMYLLSSKRRLSYSGEELTGCMPSDSPCINRAVSMTAAIMADMQILWIYL